MPSYLQARVLDITETKAGSEVSQTYPVGTTVLELYDVSDFAEEGGEVEIEGEFYPYVSKDDDLLTLVLEMPLTIEVPIDTEVFLYPWVVEKDAMCQIDEEDSVMARVPHSLTLALEEMVRDGYDEESVLVTLEDDEWVIHDVIAETYRLLIEDIEGLPEDLQTALERAQEALAEAEAAMGFIQAKVDVTRGPTLPDPESGKLNDIHFLETENGLIQYIHNGTTWVDARDQQAIADLAQALVDSATALTNANNALTAATTAQDEVDAANDLLAYWTYTGTIEMDGGALRADTVDAAAIAADAITAKHTLTGAKIQTTATASRGIKLNNAGLTAYSSTGAATFTIDAATGSVAMLGSLTSGSTVSGATVTGGLIQTQAGSFLGIKMNSLGLSGYRASDGARTFYLDATNGAVTMLGSLTAGSDIYGATMTASQVQTTNAVNSGIKFNTNGLTAYNSSGNPTFTVTASTGDVALLGTLIAGSSIYGADIYGSSFSTAETGNRVYIDSVYANINGVTQSWGLVQFHTGASGWNPGQLWGNYAGGYGNVSLQSPGYGSQDRASITLGADSSGFRHATIYSKRLDLNAESYYLGSGAGTVDFRLVGTEFFQIIGPSGVINFNTNPGANTNSIGSWAVGGATRQALAFYAGGQMIWSIAAAGGTRNLTMQPAYNYQTSPSIIDGSADAALIFRQVGPGRIDVADWSGDNYKTIRAGDFNVSSDMAHKESLEPVTGALAAIDALEFVDYDIIDTCVPRELFRTPEAAIEGRGRGVVAQQAQGPLPEAVKGSEEPGDLGVDLYAFSTTIGAATKELYALVKDLTEEVTQLKKLITS